MSARERDAILAKREADAKLAEEKRMLEASGALRETAEAVVRTPAAPRTGSVRVVEVTGKGYALAACRDSERLIGGSCEGGVKESRPAEFSKSDTLGARWSCKGNYTTNKLTAFALCALVEPAEPAAAEPVAPDPAEPAKPAEPAEP